MRNGPALERLQRRLRIAGGDFQTAAHHFPKRRRLQRISIADMLSPSHRPDFVNVSLSDALKHDVIMARKRGGDVRFDFINGVIKSVRDQVSEARAGHQLVSNGVSRCGVEKPQLIELDRGSQLPPRSEGIGQAVPSYEMTNSFTVRFVFVMRNAQSSRGHRKGQQM